MANYRDYLNYAEGFYLQAKEASSAGSSGITERSLIASVLLSWIAMESFVNNMMADFRAIPQDLFTLPEQAFLAEHELEFVDSGTQAGEFTVSTRRRYRPLDHKILFLVAKFSKGIKLNRGQGLWQKFKIIKRKRDQLTHPRKSEEVTLTLGDAGDAFEVAKAIILMISKKVWGKEVEL